MFEHWWELGILLAIAVVVLGPNRLPEAGKGLGKALRGFRRETQGLREDIASIKAETAGIHEQVTEVKDSVRTTVTDVLAPPPRTSPAKLDAATSAESETSPSE